eukprot:99052-Pleurochrysis_carterae.AAC.2
MERGLASWKGGLCLCSGREAICDAVRRAAGRSHDLPVVHRALKHRTSEGDRLFENHLQAHPLRAKHIRSNCVNA